MLCNSILVVFLNENALLEKLFLGKFSMSQRIKLCENEARGDQKMVNSNQMKAVVGTVTNQSLGWDKSCESLLRGLI